MILTRVLLPAPFSPASACTRPPKSCKLTSDRTSTAPKRLLIFRSSRTGSMISSLSGEAASGPSKGLAPACRRGDLSEVEILIVVLRELHRLTGDDLPVLADGVRAGPFALLDGERIARLSCDLAVGQRHRRVIGHVAELARIPEIEPSDRSVEHVFRGDARHAIAGELYFSMTLIHRFERSRHGWKTRACRSKDADEIGVLGRERHRGVKGFLLVIVPINGVDQLDARVLLDLVLKRFDPQILIGGRRLGRNDRNLALGIRPHLSDEQLPPETADRIARRLIDEEWPAAGRVSVEGHDLDAKLLRTLHCRNDSVRIARRDRNGGHTAFGEAIDNVDLRFCARLSGAVVGDFASGLFRGDFGPGKRGVVVGIGGRLDHHSQLEGGCGQSARDAGCAEKRARREKPGKLFRHGSSLPAWFGRQTPGRWFPRRWIIAPERKRRRLLSASLHVTC